LGMGALDASAPSYSYAFLNYISKRRPATPISDDRNHMAYPYSTGVLTWISIR
jgi:hypothetical protein